MSLLRNSLLAVALLLFACDNSPKRYLIAYTENERDTDPIRYESREEPKLSNGIYSFKATNGAEYRLPASRVMVTIINAK